MSFKRAYQSKFKKWKNYSEVKHPKNVHRAVEYARLGIPVFPCDPKTKRPLVRNGFHAASTDVEEVRRMFAYTNKDALIGSPTKGYMILDIDIKKDKNGFEIIESAGHPMMVVKTPSGGYHYYYHFKGQKRDMTYSPLGVDILGEGGYAILPDQENYIMEENIKDEDSLPWFAFNDYLETAENMGSHIANELVWNGIYCYQFKSDKDIERVAQKRNKKLSRWKKIQNSTKRSNAAKKLMGSSVKNTNLDPKSPDDRTPFKLRSQPVSPESKAFYNQFYKGLYKDVDKETIASLFTDVDLQIILAEMMVGEALVFQYNATQDMSSFLEGHADNVPSTRFSWNEGTLLYLDYACFHGVDRFCQKSGVGANAYTVVDLYFHLCTGKIKKLTYYDKMLWGARLLHEAGILVLPEHKKMELPEKKLRYFLGNELFEEFKYCFDMIKLRFGFYYDLINTPNSLTRNWTALWCGITEQKAAVIISILYRLGVIEEKGKIKGRFNTEIPIYSWNSNGKGYTKLTPEVVYTMYLLWSNKADVLGSSAVYKGIEVFKVVYQQCLKSKSDLPSDETICQFIETSTK